MTLGEGPNFKFLKFFVQKVCLFQLFIFDWRESFPVPNISSLRLEEKLQKFCLLKSSLHLLIFKRASSFLNKGT